MVWIDSLSDQQSPSWLGLPNNAQNLLLLQQGAQVLIKLLRMQQLDDEEVDISNQSDDAIEKSTSDSRPAWMKTLQASIQSWMTDLPKTLTLLKASPDQMKDPLHRFFEREIKLARALHATVIGDLTGIGKICSGELKQAYHFKDIGLELVKGMIPSAWRKYTIPRDTTVNAWLNNFSRRLQQLEKISQACQGGSQSLRGLDFWLGGFFNPEAFITATRQCTAQANFWSLEDLQLKVDVGPAEGNEMAFNITDVQLYGASCVKAKLELNESQVTELKRIRFQWVKKGEDGSSSGSKTIMELPLYLNSDRATVLVNVQFELHQKDHERRFVETAVAFLANP